MWLCDCIDMGNGESVKAEKMPQHFEPLGVPPKQIRASIRGARTPMPADPSELDRRFMKVLVRTCICIKSLKLVVIFKCLISKLRLFT